MNKKILVLYQDWGDWLTKDYSRFEQWFKRFDGAYSSENDYYILAFGNCSKKFKLENNVFVEVMKSSPTNQFRDLFIFRKKIIEIIFNFKPTSIYSPFIYLLSQVPKSKNYTIFGFVRDKTAEMIKASGGVRKVFGNIFYLLDYLAFKKIDSVFHNGKSMEKYAKTLGFKGTSIYCPRPVMDFENLDSISKEDLKKELNLQNKKIILSVARLTNEKNLLLGIETMKSLSDDYVYLIVGEGIQKEYLEKKIQELNLIDKVKLVGFVNHKNIWKYHKMADVFWLLSKTDFEGTPNVLQEAYYSQTPCVVSKISAMKNIVEDGEDSLILTFYDSKELANKTKELLIDPEFYLNIQKNQKIKINNILKQNKKIEVYFK